MKRMTHSRGASGESGFTLTEMLVVMSLLSIVLGAAYMFIYAARAGQSNSDKEATLSRAVTLPLQSMERILIQNSAIAPSPTPTGYKVTVLTDQDANNVLEQRTFEAVQDPATGMGYIKLTTYLTDASGARVGAALQDGYLARDNANIADGVPLFLYYASDGTQITDPGAVSMQARSVVVQIRAVVAGRSETHADKITFRNR